MTIALLCMVVQTAWAQFSGGSGTQADPYQISSVADWNTLATNVEAGDSYSGMYFTLTEDIDNIETMVGSEGKPFSGQRIVAQNDVVPVGILIAPTAYM